MWKDVGSLHGTVASDDTGVIVPAFRPLLYPFHTLDGIFGLPCSPFLLEHQDDLIHGS
jgi:hypothetical protein